MSDRGVFLAAFLTLVLVVAGAFALPELFIYELLKSTIFVVIAVMVFFGDDKFPYMLGMIAPILWFIFSLLTGGFIGEIGSDDPIPERQTLWSSGNTAARLRHPFGPGAGNSLRPCLAETSYREVPGEDFCHRLDCRIDLDRNSCRLAIPRDVCRRAAALILGRRTPLPKGRCGAARSFARSFAS